jgi:FAD/FMN-containing dehydrogenase
VFAWKAKRSVDSSSARDQGSLSLIVALWWIGIALDFSLSLFLPQAAISWQRTLLFIAGICLMLLGVALRWYACTIFNLHTVHSPEGLQRSENAFRRLIDMAARRGGSYYLTYHRYATRKQVESCYPQFAEFLRLKKRYDPEERFQSDWYRHYRTMFADIL